MSSEDPVGRSRSSKEAQSRETRARLVGAAIACVARSGYAGTTTAQVAHEAGLTRGALQYQFADKTDLMLAMAETLYEAQVARVSERLAGGGSFERRFGALLDAAFEMSESPAHVVFLELWMAARTDADRVRLEVVDPPTVPTIPSGPNRLLFASGVLAAGIGAGLVLVFLLIQLDRGFYTTHDLRGLGLPVLGGVSSANPPKRQVFAGVVFAGGFAMLLLAFGGVLAGGPQLVARMPGVLARLLT